MSERNLTNKVVVITGSAQGIGYDIADKFLQKHVKVVVVVDIIENGDEAISGLKQKHGTDKLVYYKADVRNENLVSELYVKLINKYETVDVLVNNAGVINEIDWHKSFDVNAKAVINWTYKYFEHMRMDKGGKGGTVINICSVNGFRISAFAPTYNAAKFAVFGFTKSLGHEYNYNLYGVRIVAICPGYTKTHMSTLSDVKLWSDTITADLAKFLKNEDSQEVDVVGKAAVEVFEKADSGTNWLIEGGRPIVQV